MASRNVFELLADAQFVRQDGSNVGIDALSGKTVGFYFSAHWCPPCRQFTPILKDFYGALKRKDPNFEIVFVSSDKSEREMKSYFNGEHGDYLALEYANRAGKDAVSKLFSCKGIPQFTVVDENGEVLNQNARKPVMGGADGVFENGWKPRSLAQLLANISLQRQDGSTVGADAIAGKTLGLYFSAHWCPPCRAFTPKLKEFYRAYKERDPNFEIIFVSSDKDEAEMRSYFNESHGDYLCLPFDSKTDKADLNEILKVDGIPHFSVLAADGTILNQNARGKVDAGVDAVLADGWQPPVVGDMANGPDAAGSDINESATIVVSCPHSSEEEQTSIFEAMRPLAEKYRDEAAGGTPKYIFIISKSDEGVASQIKALTRKAAGADMDAAGDVPQMLLFDIPDNGGFYLSETHEITTEAMANFIAAKENGSVRRRQLGK